MPEQSNERTYFTKQAADALLCINQDRFAPKPLLFLKMVQAIKEVESDPDDLERVLALRSVMYGQLAKRPQPPMDNRRNIPGEEGDMPDELDKYTCFDVIEPKGGKEVAKRYVQAPQAEGGWFAEVFGTISLKYHVQLDFQIDLGTFNDDEDGDGGYGTSPREQKIGTQACDEMLTSVFFCVCARRTTTGLRLSNHAWNARQGEPVHQGHERAGNVPEADDRPVAFGHQPAGRMEVRV